MTKNFNLLVKKIDKFIKRYYKNIIIKGVIYFLASIGSIFLIYVLLEYFGYFSSFFRGVLFYSFIVISIFILIRNIIVPSLKLYKIGKTIDQEEAARVVGKHFKGVIDDKIINVIQLNRFLDKKTDNFDLLVASIDQKAQMLSGVRFDNVIKYKENIKYAKWAFIPALIITILFILTPFVVIEPASRIIQYDKHFERPAPFEIQIKNCCLKAFQNEDFELNFSVSGTIFPDNVKVQYGGSNFMAKKESKEHFSYLFKNLQQNKRFYLYAAGYKFGPYELSVVPKPVINNFEIEVISPQYTRKEEETFNNYGDITVAEGSEIAMRFNTRFTDEVLMETEDIKKYLEETERGIFEFSTQVFEGFKYNIYTKNEHTDLGDSIGYAINIIRDRYPEITINKHQDSVLLSHKFFTGQIRDDYGFTELAFKYRISDDFPDNDKPFEKINIPIEEESTNQSFTHHLDLNTLNISPGNIVEYFFAVWDNDGINGPKKSESRTFTYRVPTHDEINRETRRDYDEISEELSTSARDASEARDEIEELRRKLLEKEEIGWEEKEAFNKILEEHKKMKEKLEELQEKKRKSEVRHEEFLERSEDIKKKQEELQRIFDEALSDEFKEMFEKIRQELDKLTRDEMYEHLEKMDFEFGQFENQMERVLELFKMLEFQNMLNESVESTERLKEGQKELMDKLDDKGDIEESAYDEQEALKDNFEKLTELLELLEEKNRDLQRPQNIPDTRDFQHNIDYDMNKALEQINNLDFDNTKFHQEQTFENLEQLLQELQNFQNSIFSEELAEDARLLRQLLQNLLKTSFDQEELMKEIREINLNDPRYVKLIQEQRKIFDDLGVIEDSLVALSKRQVHVRSFINREIAEINMNIEKAIPDMINRRRHAAASRQQFVMKHVNNLALMLNESLQNMQMQMAMQQGFGDHDQMGQGAPSLKDLIDMQQQANEMLDKIRQGHQPEPGETGEEMSLSEQLARMSLQQEKIRNKLRELTEQFKKDYDISTRELEQIQREMERTEMEIVTNNINRQTMLRQDRILTRLLEHERALMERELDDQRVGEVPEFYELSNPEDFFEYNRLRNQQIELLKKNNVEFKRFYNNLVEKYFLKFKE